MHFIGITGGIGAGKSKLLTELANRDDSIVIFADKLAKDLMMPHEACYDDLCRLFTGMEVFDENGHLIIDNISRIIFDDDALRSKLNSIVHPAVKERILEMVSEAEHNGAYKFFFLEAALLLEEGYDRICEEIWYIYASKETRCRRLMDSRGYSRDKAYSIISSQLDEEEFRKRCQRIIDNDGKLWKAKEQLQSCVEAILKKDEELKRGAKPAEENQR